MRKFHEEFFRPHGWKAVMRMTRRQRSSLRRYSRYGLSHSQQLNQVPDAEFYHLFQRCISQLEQRRGLQLVSDNQRIVQLRKMQKRFCIFLIYITIQASRVWTTQYISHVFIHFPYLGNDVCFLQLLNCKCFTQYRACMLLYCVLS